MITSVAGCFPGEKGFFAALDGLPALDHGVAMNGFLAIGWICREIMS